jgi:hypothetical protein
MNNVFAILGLLCILSAPLKVYSAPICQEVVQEKPKKEILISIQGNKENYKTPVKVIEGLFKQAGIIDYYIENPEKIEKKEVGIFQFRNRTLSQAIKIISSIYDLDFLVEDDGKNKFYKVKMRQIK